MRRRNPPFQAEAAPAQVLEPVQPAAAVQPLAPVPGAPPAVEPAPPVARVAVGAAQVVLRGAVLEAVRAPAPAAGQALQRAADQALQQAADQGAVLQTPTTRPEFLYAVANQQQGPVYEFKIDTTTGTFSPISGSPYSADVGNPTVVCTVGCGASLIADPLGRFLYYQFNYGGSSVTNGLDSLAVDPATGALSGAGKYSQPVYQLAADPQGRYVYWNQSGGLNNAIGGLAVSSTGALTPTPGQPYIYDGQVSYGAPAITSNYVFALTYMTATGGTGSLYEWTIDPATGTLTRTGNTMPVDKGAAPAVTPDGKFLYVEEMYLNNGVGYWQIVPIQIASNGGFIKLSQFAQQTPLQGDSPILISPNGNFLYISIYGNIWLFQINKTTGELKLIHKYTDIMANLYTFDPAGKFLFASPEGLNQIGTTTLTTYSVNSTTGELTPVANSTVDLKAVPIALAVVSPPVKQ